jgi:hypothetical protein
MKVTVTPAMLRNALGVSDSVQIIPGLYIGSVIDGTCPAFLREHDISTVINCTKGPPGQVLTKGYHQVPVDDDLSDHEIQKMYAAFPDVVAIIDACLKNRDNVLVHCHAGRQRSASVVCAYLMWKYGTPLDTAIRRLRRRKPDVFRPGTNFLAALRLYSRDICNSPETSERTRRCTDAGNMRVSHDNRSMMTDSRRADPDQSTIPAR